MASHESDRAHEQARFTHQLFTPLTRFEHETLVDAVHDAYVDDDEPLLDIHDRHEQRRQEQAFKWMLARARARKEAVVRRSRRRLRMQPHVITGLLLTITLLAIVTFLVVVGLWSRGLA
jgi:hypothetical protein